MKFKRHIYVGDIHGSKYFDRFISMNDDGETFFVFLGDFFDRGEYSYDVYRIIRSLVESGKAAFVLGNHDIFFILGFALSNKGLKHSKTGKIAASKISQNELKRFGDIFLAQYHNNGGQRTTESFRRAFDLKIRPSDSAIFDAVDFLFENGTLAFVDSLFNVSVHGGIPVLYDGTLVGTRRNGVAYFGLDFVEFLGKGLKSFDPSALNILSAIDNKSINMLERETRGKSIDLSDPELNEIRPGLGSTIIPTWYDNSLYDNDKGDTGTAIFKTLRSDLDRHGLCRLFAGYWWNKSPTFGQVGGKSEELNRTIVRLDRRHLKTGNPDIYLGIEALYPEAKIKIDRKVPKQTTHDNFGYAIVSVLGFHGARRDKILPDLHGDILDEVHEKANNGVHETMMKGGEIVEIGDACDLFRNIK